MWNDFWLHSQHNHGVFEGSMHWPSTVNKSEVIGLSRREEAIRCTIHLSRILILLDKTFFYCGQSLKSWHLFLNMLALRKPMRNATAMQIRELASRWHAIGDSSFIRTLVRCDFVEKNAYLYSICGISDMYILLMPDFWNLKKFTMQYLNRSIVLTWRQILKSTYWL